jgi:hypothetical protein
LAFWAFRFTPMDGERICDQSILILVDLCHRQFKLQRHNAIGGFERANNRGPGRCAPIREPTQYSHAVFFVGRASLR